MIECRPVETDPRCRKCGAEGKLRLIDDPGRLDGATTIGYDEHVWRHTRFGEKCVTVIVDLTRPTTRRA